MKRKILYLLAIVMLANISVLADPTLKSADLVVVMRNTDLDDQFVLMALADIPGGSVIFITDEGYDENGFWFDGSEDVFKVIIPAEGVFAGDYLVFTNYLGTTLTIQKPSNAVVTHPNGTSDMSLSAGDQLFIYQTSDNTYSGEMQRLNSIGGIESGLIYAFNGDNSSPSTYGWLDPGNLHTPAASQAPPNMTVVTETGGLGDAFGLLTQDSVYAYEYDYVSGTSYWTWATNEYDNYVYSGPTAAGDKEEWLRRIHTTKNWKACDSDTFRTDFAYTPVEVTLPVELTFFSCVESNEIVALCWETATELNNYGFEIERAVAEENKSFQKIGFVEGHGNSNSVKAYSFVDCKPVEGKAVYRLKQIDFDGKYEYSKEIEVSYDAVEEFALEQNYPNPFNPTTNISFKLAVSGKVSVKIFNAIGQEVAELVNKTMEVGSHEVTFNASDLPSGTYFCRMNAGGFTKTSKMLLIK